MDSILNTQYTFFISDKNYILPKENDNIVIHKYFDISKNHIFSFIFQDNDLFIILNQNTFGSAFFGNTVITQPHYLIIKKFNPIFILIQILYPSQTEEEKNTKNKKFSSKDFIDTSELIQQYEDKLKTYKNKNDIFNYKFDSIFKSSVNFVKKIFAQNSKNLELISEIKEIECGDLEGDKKICAKKCESKVYNYLNSKVNLTPSEEKEIDESETADKSEKDILKQRKTYEKITILEPFLPNELYKDYLKYKHYDFLSEDEISNISNDSVKNKNKRKRTPEKTNKKKRGKKGKGNDDKLTPKDQKTIFDMLKKD